jgi:predicted RNA-binding protein YlqC (UPF0109 family)
LENLVKYIVCELVDDKESVVVETREESEKVSIINVTVNKDDVGKIIGRNGKIAGSIRTIVKSASAKSGKRFIVKIGERD